jgi:predicted ATPase/DNA-binding CsgD family transcriptional regulator
LIQLTSGAVAAMTAPATNWLRYPPDSGENDIVHQERVPRGTGISGREAEVLAGIAKHLTNAEIAARLFISVRTVESHVSSMLRKFGATDRRALAVLAADMVGRVAPSRPPTQAAPLTPFIGREAERAALVVALAEHRLVTAVGLGGIGKTRLVLAAAAELTERFADGVWYVDLIPVTDDAMVAAALAGALGFAEQLGRSVEETVLGWLGGREALIVLDNCEHLAGGVVVIVERLLAACPRVRVLATSRVRLLVPYEHVFLVPGMTVFGDGGDAVELFLGRAAATGGPVGIVDRHRIAAICRGLDGVALAIELAAARLPALGVDGLEAGLDDRLRLLAGGRRLDDRHRSLRSALNWSYALLSETERAILRRISVFATAFTADAAAALLVGWPSAEAAEVPAGLAGLADHSLLVAVPGPDGTRYRALETIRQYGAERLAEAGELTEAHNRHLRWCLAEAEALDESQVSDLPQGRIAFDRVADELRTALDWVATQPDQHGPGYRLAIRLAALSFVRGLPGEAQRRFEQAAAFAADGHETASALQAAASVAEIRHFGNEAIRLHRACADAALRGGDRPLAAYHLAQIAELCERAAGIMSEPPPGSAELLLAEASALTDGDPAAKARVVIAEAFNRPRQDPMIVELADRGLALARQAGDPLAESAALDLLTDIQLSRGEIRAAAASALRRMELLAPLRGRAYTCGLEMMDAPVMAAETAVAVGDLAAARRLAEVIRGVPFYREEGHLATARLLVVTALAGDWDDTAAFGTQFREGWERAGRPRAGNLNRGAYAAAAVCGLRGDEAGRAEWLRVVDGLTSPGRPLSELHHGEFFDALVLLHGGRPDQAVTLLGTPPEEFRAWYNVLWRPWYVALWAEAAMLAGHPSAADRISRARRFTADNPIALAIVERSVALAAGDRDGVLVAAARLRAAGCRYQWARTLVLADGPERTRGEEELRVMGATPMAAG